MSSLVLAKELWFGRGAPPLGLWHMVALAVSGCATMLVPLVSGLLLAASADEFASPSDPVVVMSVVLVLASAIGMASVLTFRLRQAKRAGASTVLGALVVLNSGLGTMLSSAAPEADPMSAWFVASAITASFLAMIYIGVAYLVEERVKPPNEASDSQ